MLAYGQKWSAIFHMSNPTSGLMASVDAGNAGVLNESPSNKNYKWMDAAWQMAQSQSGLLNRPKYDFRLWYCHALNFNGYGLDLPQQLYCLLFRANTDVKIISSQFHGLFDWVANTVIRTFWHKLDKPIPAAC